VLDPTDGKPHALRLTGRLLMGLAKIHGKKVSTRIPS